MTEASHSHLQSAAVHHKSKISPEDDAELCHQCFHGRILLPAPKEPNLTEFYFWKGCIFRDHNYIFYFSICPALHTFYSIQRSKNHKRKMTDINMSDSHVLTWKKSEIITDWIQMNTKHVAKQINFTEFPKIIS